MSFSYELWGKVAGGPDDSDLPWLARSVGALGFDLGREGKATSVLSSL